jgi:hypothetical protein
MQLVAYGAQDIYLTGNPQITFFKVVYRRHTNFAVEAIEQTFNGSAAEGQKFSCTISRNGDLLHRVYLEVDVSAKTQNGGNRGFQMIDYVEVEIGGQCIDKHYGEWMAIWCSLTHDTDKQTLLELMCPEVNADPNKTEKVYLPLQFWFCRNPGLALPLIALQYHEVKLNVQFSNSNGNANDLNCCVFCDYIFLDTDERRRFAQVSHEYLIEQVQTSNVLNVGSAELRFNHPVKEIVWVGASDNDDQPIEDALLQLNGHDRFRKRSGSYFSDVQRYEHHTGANNLALLGCPNNVNMYSFALKPEEHQPSGTCNFSRIDNAVLTVNATSMAKMKVYAVNYNVLRIMSGMGGLAYSN